jgi:hypothetical protein
MLTDQLNGLKPSTKRTFWRCFREVYGEQLSKGRGKSSGKTVSGWNGFMAEKMKEVKEDESIEPNNRLKVIAEMWSDLGDDGKAEWCEEHGYPAPKSPAKKAKSKDVETEKPKRKSLSKKKKSSDDEEDDEPPKKKTPVKSKKAPEPEVDEAVDEPEVDGEPESVDEPEVDGEPELDGEPPKANEKDDPADAVVDPVPLPEKNE